jgi:hypothetical protein
MRCPILGQIHSSTAHRQLLGIFTHTSLLPGVARVCGIHDFLRIALERAGIQENLNLAAGSQNREIHAAPRGARPQRL